MPPCTSSAKLTTASSSRNSPSAPVRFIAAMTRPPITMGSPDNRVNVWYWAGDGTTEELLAGGAGTRLYPLTAHRSKPAVPLAGKYRLIDVPISNCINSGISIHRHSHVLILSGDQLYLMDYRRLFDFHRQTGADVTLATIPVVAEEAPAFGILKTDQVGRITEFHEKPPLEALEGADLLEVVRLGPAELLPPITERHIGAAHGQRDRRLQRAGKRKPVAGEGLGAADRRGLDALEEPGQEVAGLLLPALELVGAEAGETEGEGRRQHHQERHRRRGDAPDPGPPPDGPAARCGSAS